MINLINEEIKLNWMNFIDEYLLKIDKFLFIDDKLLVDENLFVDEKLFWMKINSG